jgi:hypothetical protein
LQAIAPNLAVAGELGSSRILRLFLERYGRQFALLIGPRMRPVAFEALYEKADGPPSRARLLGEEAELFRYRVQHDEIAAARVYFDARPFAPPG